jgi:bilirubin oxidase
MKSKKIFIISALFLLATNSSFSQTYTSLNIPEAYYGVTGTDGVTNFVLNMDENLKQYRTGQATVTGAVNIGTATTNTFWGPTMIINKDQAIKMHVTNNLNESSTIHWHGMHLPAIMDGGPHQIIAAGALWEPYWTVKNQAATLWYHPHLHTTTQAQVTKGVGGFIIVKDAAEAALALPRTYGIDDIPLAITSRRFLSTTNAMSATLSDNYGDYVMVNGTLSTTTNYAQATLPKQVVRMRILNGEIQRGYNLGFSDNRTFYVIGNDGGLLNAPVAVTRLAVQTGERFEILVNLSNDTVGSQTLYLKAYNSATELNALTPGSNAFGWPGNEGNASTPTGNSGPLNGGLLNNVDFNIMNIQIAATTTASTPITTIPTALISNTYWATTDVTNSRTITVGGGNGGTAFTLDGSLYSTTMTPKTVNLNAIEKWTIVNNNIFGHAFHLHDVFFKIISRSGGNIGTTIRTFEQGWKDSVWIPINGTVTFIAKFDDYSDSTWPYMYHCHALTHEDEGMMGQFTVNGTMATNENSVKTIFSLYPNPTTDKLFINLSDASTEIYYITITTLEGRVAMMLPKPQWQNGIDISSLSSGVYLLKLTDEKTKSVTTKKFIKN